MKSFFRNTWNQPMAKFIHLVALPLFIVIWTGYALITEHRFIIGPLLFAVGFLIIFWVASYLLRNNP